MPMRQRRSSPLAPAKNIGYPRATSPQIISSTDELQIKMAQGAKPGEGGQLPGHKVDEVITRIRHSIPGVGLISPPPHHDIYSISLAQLILDLKNVNPQARIAVISGGISVGTVARRSQSPCRCDPDPAGDTGGTGASPLQFHQAYGRSVEHRFGGGKQILLLNDLRSHHSRPNRWQVANRPRRHHIAALLGAEEFGFATTPLIAMGCVMMRKVPSQYLLGRNCHAQDPVLRKQFQGQPGTSSISFSTSPPSRYAVTCPNSSASVPLR